MATWKQMRRRLLGVLLIMVFGGWVSWTSRLGFLPGFKVTGLICAFCIFWGAGVFFGTSFRHDHSGNDRGGPRPRNSPRRQSASYG